MNYLLMVKERVVDPVNDYVVAPVITNPINNYIINPIQNLVKREEEISKTLDVATYTTFDSYPPSTESMPLLDNKEVSYFDNVKEKMYYSGLTFKASFYFFVNAWLPNIFKEEGHVVLENLKKND
jgi:hypothetical protein